MALLTAMGADPVQGMLAADVRQGLRDGSLDGVEMAPTFIRPNNFQLEAPYLTSFALLPKFEVLAASAEAWGGLSTEDRVAVSGAAAATVERIASTLELRRPGGPGRPLPDRPRRGATHDRGAGRLAGSRPRRARRECAHGRGDQPARSTTTGRPTTRPPFHRTCPVAASAGQARRLHRAALAAPTGVRPRPAHPAGDLPGHGHRRRLPGARGRSARRSRTGSPSPTCCGRTARSGTTQDPDFPDQGPSDGRYDTDGYQVTFTYLHNDFGGELIAPETMHWSAYDGTLTFTDIHAADPAGEAIYGAPWHLVSD